MEQIVQRQQLLLRIAIAAALLVFIGIAGWRLATPGLYYDEMLFVDAALGSPNGIFISMKFGELPIMLMPYIGALKAWLYYPIFKLFGVSAFTVRAPMVLLGALTLWLNYQVALRAFSRPVALSFLAMAALEPSTLFHTRIDWGPTALMMLFRALLLLSIVSWIKTRNPRYLVATLGVTLLGLFDKLNFLWFCPALLLAVLCLYPREVVTFCRQHTRFCLGLAIAAAGVGGILLFYLTNYVPLEEEIGNMDWPQRWAVVQQLLLMTIAGTGVYAVVTTGDMAVLGQPHLQALGVVAAIATVIAILRRRDIDWRMTAFFVIFFGVTLAEAAVTRQATGPHHTATLAPAWLLLLAIPLGHAWQGDWLRKPLAGIASMAIVALCVSSLRVDLGNLQGFAQLPRPLWDPATTLLSDEVARHPGQPVITVDWGSGSIVSGLLDGKVPVLDLWAQFNDGPGVPEMEWYEQMITDSDPLFVLPAETMATFPDARTNFLAIASERQWNLQQVATFNTHNDVPLYELYTVILPSSR